VFLPRGTLRPAHQPLKIPSLARTTPPAIPRARQGTSLRFASDVMRALRLRPQPTARGSRVAETRARIRGVDAFIHSRWAGVARVIGLLVGEDL